MKNDNTSYERYQRQVILKEFGEAGQQKLLKAKALVIGAGGLGCPALQYLAAAGVGNIGIVDDDVVSITNLHRQPLYNTMDIGFAKAGKAKHALARLNPEINITAYPDRLTTSNALDIIEAYDVVIDGTDNFATRYMINDACVLLNKPLVYGAVSQFEGQVAVFHHRMPTGEYSVNYRHLFPNPPKQGEVLSCAEAGVLGVLPGIIGTMQANETIKLITGMGELLINSILTYNALTNHTYEIGIPATTEAESMVPASAAAFKQMDYQLLCSSVQPDGGFEIDAIHFDTLLNKEAVEIIDVRETHEWPLPTGFNYKRISLMQLKEAMPAIKSNTVIVFCQSGKRSLQAAQWLFDEFGESKKIYSLQGGIIQWINNHSTAQV
ncbi:MAG: moeB [Ferruginibacter sp.]|nr:moeB [Ferruginibacter sp.]